MTSMTEDIYKFVDNYIIIRSNSDELRDHFRSVYKRFYRGAADKPERSPRACTVHKINIIENSAGSDEITINDSFYLYRISKRNGTYKLTSQALQSKAPKYTDEGDLLRFVQTVVLRTITLLLTDYHLFHAGVVSWRGKGMIFAAHPNMGKTTLVLKLAMSGCKFLSDEVACFKPDLRMLQAFPRRVGIRHNSLKLLDLPQWSDGVDFIKTDENGWLLDIEDIVPGSLIESCPPHVIFFLRGFGDRPRLEPIPASVALVELLKFTYCPVPDPAKLMFECAPMINKLRCYNLISGNINETAKLIMDEADRRISADG